jgi:two-component system, LytTR family, sensor kinase
LRNTIRVKLERADQMFRASFYNSKEENPGQLAEHPGGLGLKNIRRRLQLLYPHAYTLDIKDLPNSYEVELTLRIHEL